MNEHSGGSDALRRFCAMYDELVGRSKWYESRDAFRFAVMALVQASGSVSEVSARLHATVKDMRARTKWYSGMRGTQSTLIAANLVLADQTASAFLEQLERAKPWFRARWRFASETYQSLAVMVLWLHGERGRAAQPLREDDVARMESVWQAMKKDHPWITSQADWPVSALLASGAQRPAEMAARVEANFLELHRRGYRRGDALQSAAMILALQEGEPSQLGARFQSLYGTFKSAGLHMCSADYSEIATLCFVPSEGTPLVDRVRSHREVIRALKPKPAKQASFHLACATATLEALGSGPKATLAARAASICQIIMLIQAQQAAAAGGSAAAISAT